MTETRQPLSREVRRAEVPDEGLHVEIAADSGECVDLARYLDIPAVEAFRAEMTVEPWGKEGLIVRGAVEASVVQTCVVTLEPVTGAVVERFEDHFHPDPATLGDSSGIGAPDPDDVEPLIDQRIDLAALAVEHLVLGLDPYPRREGAVLAVAEGGPASDEAHPFAALARLRKPGRPR